MRRKVAYGIGVASLLLACWGTAGALHALYLPRGRSLIGTQVVGAVQPESQTLDSFLAQLSERAGKRTLSLDTGDSTLQVQFEQIGIELDAAQLKQAILAHAETGGTLTRLARAMRARRGQEHIAPRWSVNRAKAEQLLNELAQGLAREPRDAHVDLKSHRKIPDVSGRLIDVQASVALLQPPHDDHWNALKLIFREVPAHVSLDQLTRVDVSQVLASFETDFKGKAGRRKINIERAIQYLDGALIEAGETWSFNRTVGPRTEKRGFVSAPVIVDDIMELGIGGGVCQVASTLFAAAIHGNLEIVRRRSHSRPSGYAPLGLDAAVIDNEVDLRIKNPYEVPLLIHAFLSSETTIKVELLGHALSYPIEHQYSVTERHDFVRRVKYSEEVREAKRKQRGHYGYDVVSVVTINQKGHKPTRRSYPSTYYPVPEVYWVPPDYDLSKLPPLPEGATATIVGDTPVANEVPSADPVNRVAEPPS